MKWQVLFFVFLFSLEVYSQIVSLQFSLNKKNEISYQTSDKSNILDLGRLLLGENKEYTLRILNVEENATFKILSLRSTCSCIVLDWENAKKLPPESSLSVILKIDSSGYWGKITKFIYFRLLYMNRLFDVRIPISFTVVERVEGNTVKQKVATVQGQLCFVNFQDATKEEKQQAAAWLFASAKCPDCEKVKSDFLPSLLNRKSVRPIVILVDPDTEEGLEQLLKLLKTVGKEEFGEFPILFYKNSFYCGMNELHELIIKNNNPVIPNM